MVTKTLKSPEEIRARIIEVCLSNGGHLGASLGAVELAVALHSVFDSPREPILWDTGHQAYAHKLLTGRWEEFGTLRRKDGLAGFLSREESEHDVFGAGHAGTILSAAAGVSAARGPDADDWTVAVIGDGSLTAGMAFEALNHMATLKTGPLLIVINDNRYSIGENIGAIPTILGSTAKLGAFFAEFGFTTLHPLDGHDVDAMKKVFTYVREGKQGRRVLAVVRTEKGHGYPPAQEDPVKFHGVSGGVAATKVAGVPSSYSEAFGQAMMELAATDPRIVAITAAMKDGTGLQAFAERYPTQFYDVGISEQHAVTFAAGLATQGVRPVVAIYSTFLQRGYDQVVHDVAIQGLPVVFVVDRAGLVGQDGVTHQGAYDLVYLSAIPGMRIVAPSSYAELRAALADRGDGPLAVRYPRGAGSPSRPESSELIRRGWACLREASGKEKQVIVALGAAIDEVWKAAQMADSQGESVTVELVTWAKPLPSDWIERRRKRGTPMLFVEHGAIRGGIGEHLAAMLSGDVPVQVAGFPDRGIAHATPVEQLRDSGLDATSLVDRLKRAR